MLRPAAVQNGAARISRSAALDGFPVRRREVAAQAGGSCSRREASLLLPLGIALLSDALGLPSPARAASAGAGAQDAAEFYSAWPYVEKADILPYLEATAEQGNVSSMISAIDQFAQYYPMYRSGPEKGGVLEALVAELAELRPRERRSSPLFVLELGTFVGYGSLRIARRLPSEGRVVTIEQNEEQARVAKEVFAMAGLGAPQVQLLRGCAADVLRALARTMSDRQRQADLIFLDHCKPCYLPDLQQLEQLGFVGPGTVILADNVVFPGNLTEYLAHVGYGAGLPVDGGDRQPGLEPARSPVVGGGGVGQKCVYETRLVETAFEVEEPWREGWTPRRDAMAVSNCVATSERS